MIGEDRLAPTTHRHLTEMKYLEMAIKESLRMYPPVTFMSRQVQKDFEVDGVLYPANTNLTIGITQLHNSPELFPEPDKYKPERFDQEITKDNNPFSFIPFSAGSRNCIGQKFAMLELKAVISKVLRNFVLKLPENSEELILMTEVILKSKNGVKITLNKRP